MSACPHCNRTDFEIDEVAIAGAKLKLVQCSGCKAPVGVVESDTIAQQISAVERQLTEILHVIVTSLQSINSRLDRLDRVRR